jgi:hypothetical protein
VKLAIEHNLRIFNPDLAREVEEGRKRLRETRNNREAKGMKQERAKSAFVQYADAVDAERFRVVVTEYTETGTKAFLYDRKNNGYEGKTKEEIIEAIPKFSTYAYYGKNIIVTPISGDKHHILVDDLTGEKLQQLKDDGYSPACVIESSPKNYQAILTVPSVEGDSAKDRDAANRLTRELNLKYGDPKLSGSVHGHRLPPFPNRKPKHKREDGTYPDAALIEANGGICEKAQTELVTIHAAMKETARRVREAEVHRKPVSFDRGAGPQNPDGAYWAHYRDIVARQGGPSDYSSLDAMIAMRMRVTGYSAGQIQNAIETNAPALRRENMTDSEYTSKYGSRNWKRYARETTENFVFGLRGVRQYEEAREYRPRFMKVEGRSYAEELRRERERASEQAHGR